MITIARTIASTMPIFIPVRPGLRYGPTPQRKKAVALSTPLDRCVVSIRTHLLSRRLSCADPWLLELKECIATIEKMSDSRRLDEFKSLVATLRSKGHDTVSLNTTLAHAVVLLKRSIGMSPYDVQLLAVRELLRGRFVEMGTGEGKTLTMALAAAVSALDGTPVHGLTASDYLAERDAIWLSPFYAALGLSSAFVVSQMSDEQRRLAYGTDVVHVTGQQVAFDWLRDCVASAGATQRLSTRLGNLVDDGSDTHAIRTKPLLRGLCAAIVDEADSLLIDESRTPLILAAPQKDGMVKGEELVVALSLARLLHEHVDFEISSNKRCVTLTAVGESALDTVAKRFDGLWRATRYRNERVREALTVLHCWHRDCDYVVRDNRIELVDPHTGRALPDRRLQQGLHQLLELKERCSPTPANDVVASLAFQRLFLSYIKLSGMSGTLREVRAELACVYGADVVCVPPNRTSRLCRLQERMFLTSAEQLQAMVESVQSCVELGRPVLIGTRTVEQSYRVSAALDACAIVHNVLNASQIAEEASVVAEAGMTGQVTVATNMAGRGTDIQLGSGVRESGGLHIIALALNDSHRLDRQLAGRAGRQGDPGTFVSLLSLEDSSLVNETPQILLGCMKRLLVIQQRGLSDKYLRSSDRQTRAATHIEAWRDKIIGHTAKLGTVVANIFVMYSVRWIQRKIERRHARERQSALDATKKLSHHIAIGLGTDITR